jgi:hypothetical protein
MIATLSGSPSFDVRAPRLKNEGIPDTVISQAGGAVR